MDWRKPLRPFLDLKYLSGTDFGKDDGLGYDECLPGRGQAHLLLCTFGEREIRSALRHFGITDRLKGLGYSHFDLVVDASDLEHQRLQFFGWAQLATGQRSGTDLSVAPSRVESPLGEVILREAVMQPAVPAFTKTRPFSLLIIQWIRLQDPLRSAAAKTLLPGQEHPGLGLGEAVMDMLKAMAKMRRLEGMINRPEFLHNAVLYSRHFHFLNPEVKGRLQAIQRDLPHLTLRQLSWAADKGLIVEDEDAVFFRWFQAEQIWPNCDELQEFLRSAAYRDATTAAFEGHRYRLKEGAEIELSKWCEP